MISLNVGNKEIKVSFQHVREKPTLDPEWSHMENIFESWDSKIQAETYCFLFSSDKIFLSYGVAQCSKNDNFSRKIGRKISFARAVKAAFGSNKQMRRDLWDEYFKRFKNDRT